MSLFDRVRLDRLWWDEVPLRHGSSIENGWPDLVDKTQLYCLCWIQCSDNLDTIIAEVSYDLRLVLACFNKILVLMHQELAVSYILINKILNRHSSIRHLVVQLI